MKVNGRTRDHAIGFKPFRAKDMEISNKIINVRAESAVKRKEDTSDLKSLRPKITLLHSASGRRGCRPSQSGPGPG